MPELTPTARVILGMISMGKRTGYDIKALVDKSTRLFWAASYGQIYPELKRLEAKGWVKKDAGGEVNRYRAAVAEGSGRARPVRVRWKKGKPRRRRRAYIRSRRSRVTLPCTTATVYCCT